MIKKKYYIWKDLENMCSSIVNDMYADLWRPDYIVGITRGGNIPATIISSTLTRKLFKILIKTKSIIVRKLLSFFDIP